MVSNLGRYSLGLCRCRSSVTTSVARMEVWVLSHLVLVLECRYIARCMKCINLKMLICNIVKEMSLQVL